MGFVDRELSRIQSALLGADPETERWRELHAAQQALKWTTEPQGFAAPLDSILGSCGQATTGNLAAPADCPDAARHSPS